MTAPAVDVIRVLAPAKVNLCLRILGRRPDGFHELDTVFQSIDLCERVELRVARETPGDAAVPPPAGGVPPGAEPWRAADGLTLASVSRWPAPLDETNLAVRAARAWLAAVAAPAEFAARIGLHIEKHTPIGAGLGGGSADAAGVLFALNEWAALAAEPARPAKAPLSPTDLLAVAARIGSDVAFCLQGATARGRGRGEQLIPLRRAVDFALILAFPRGVGVPTGPAYARFNPETDSRQDGIDAFAQALAAGDVAAFLATIENTFERLVTPWLPRLEEFKAALRGAGCDSAFLTGSGSTICGLCLDRAKAPAIVARLAAAEAARHLDLQIAHPIDHGPRRA